jgi:hypothetical protein
MCCGQKLCVISYYFILILTNAFTMSRVFKDIRNVHFSIFILSPKLKTSNDDRILEKPGFTGNGKIIPSFSIISWGWKYMYNLTKNASVFIVLMQM